MKIPAVTDLDGCVGKHTSKIAAVRMSAMMITVALILFAARPKLNFEFESFRYDGQRNVRRKCQKQTPTEFNRHYAGTGCEIFYREFPL